SRWRARSGRAERARLARPARRGVLHAAAPDDHAGYAHHRHAAGRRRRGAGHLGERGYVVPGSGRVHYAYDPLPRQEPDVPARRLAARAGSQQGRVHDPVPDDPGRLRVLGRAVLNRGGSSRMSFGHVHTHREYSPLDGANRLEDLVRRAVDLEMPALALTDHGCMFGAWTFQQLANRHGLKPLLGMEAYVAPGDRRVKSGGTGEDKYYHLVLIARDEVGYRNIVRLTSIRYLEGFYHRPRIDREVMQKYSEGVIVTSACLAGEVARHLMAGRREQAKEAAAWY